MNLIQLEIHRVLAADLLQYRIMVMPLPTSVQYVYGRELSAREIDFFIHSDDEASDQNHGLTLVEARKNYQQIGAVLPDLKRYCRQPKKHEIPTK